MGLGGFLAARSDADHYRSERTREELEIATLPEVEAQEIERIFESYGLEPAEIDPVVQALRRKPSLWVEFMMRFELGLEKPDPRRAVRSAFTIAGAYIAGGLIPLLPYMIAGDIGGALKLSIGFTALALAVFGFVKGRFTGAPAARSALQTLLIGGLAAGAAFAIARAIG
jgi:VIT1/CCC1 family predicted Fe2+/Mn2+ transporter